MSSGSLELRERAELGALLVVEFAPLLIERVGCLFSDGGPYDGMGP